MSTTIVLEYVRDVRSQFERKQAGKFAAHIRGIVTARTNAGRVQFIELADVTGHIQVVFLAESFPGIGEYDLTKRIRVGDIITVEGEYKLSNRGVLSIFPTTPPKFISEDLAIPIREADLPYRAVGAKMIQARIIKHLRQFLDNSGFIEIEPRYLSTSWVGYGLEPIRAVFPGFGLPVYLNPSPLPQLFEAVISTAQPKFYAVARCFSSSARDTRSSTEATVLFCLERLAKPTSNSNIWDIALRNVRALLEAAETSPADLNLGEATFVEGQWPLKAPYVEGFAVQRCVRPSIPFRERPIQGTKLELVEVLQFARVALTRGGQQYVFAECSEERRFGAIAVLCTTYHTEHILDLLVSTPFRALRTSTFWND